MKTVTGRLILDEHVATVVEFMERNIPADRLGYVATVLPMLAKVIWAPDRCATIEHVPLSRGTQLDASESGLASECVGGDSVAAVA